MRHLTACSLLGLLALAAPAQPYKPDSRTLLLDHFDETFVPDGKLMTKPEVGGPQGPLTGGRPMAGLSFVLGKFGQALEFHGLAKMDYPAGPNLNLSAGMLEFWVALNFDAAEVKKNPGVLSNQLFATIAGPGGSQVLIYSTLGQICLGVWDRQRQLIQYGGAPGDWKRDEWHHVQVRWGRQLEMWLDEKRVFQAEWFGLFGPVDVSPDEVRLAFGSQIGMSGVHSEFKLDELRVLGPGGEQITDYPTMTVCRIKAPTVDGKIEAAEWAGAARTTGFIRLNEATLADDQTIVYAGWDDQALYLAYDCLNPQRRDLVARLKDHDSGVYMEDAVDFICRPNPEAFPYYQFICNAIGTVYDSTIDPTRQTKADLAYNPDCTFRTSRQDDRWQVECKIPFAQLGGRAAPREGERWRVNFCRDSESVSNYSSWAYAAGNFHTVENYGELIFSTSDRAIRVGPLGDLAMGKVEAGVALTGFLFDPLVIVKGTLLGPNGKVLAEQENRLADYRAVTLKAPPLVTGGYNLIIRATTAAGPMVFQRLPFRVKKAYDVSVEGYPYEGKLWITANVSGLANAPQGLVARSRLMQGDRVVAECSTDRFAAGLGAASLPTADLAPGKYVVKSEAVAPDGKVLGSAEAEFEQFARPAWWHNTIALDHAVPVPWTPVRVDREGIKVLGRVYRVGEGSLPLQIINQGQEMLTGPVTLQATSDGRSADLARLRAVDAAHPDDASERHASGVLGRVRAELTTTTEFDGLQRCDLTLTPDGVAEVSALTLEIPVKSQYAAFLCPSTGHTSPALTTPPEGWKSAFMPQVWVGNDDLGLAWIAESDEWWRPHDDQMVEVLPRGGTTLLRCNILRQPLKLTQPVTITFALMATPVKDAHAGDPFWVRFGAGEGKAQCQEWCRYPATANVDLKQGTMECWFAPAADMNGSWRQVMAVVGAKGDMQVYYLPGPEQQLAMLVTSSGKQLSTATKNLQLAPGKFAHVAVTWSDKIRLFVDGKLAATLDTTLPPDLDESPAKFRLMLGCPRDWRGYTKVIVDEFRVSRTVRYTGDYAVPTAAFAKDADTLLLDHFECSFRPDGEDAETQATVISGRSDELGGVPSLNCRFVPGKFGQGLNLTMLDPMPRAEAVKRWGFNASLHWWWLEEGGEKYGWPAPLMTEPEIPNLRETVREDTALGLRPSTYAIYPAVGSPSRESAQFGYEWSRRPMSTQPSEPPKGHYFWDVCAHSGWADYIVAGSQWLLDDVGFTSLYTDGAAQAYACRNTHHGCGWTDEQGQVHATFPVFATREMLKRVYKLIHARHADGYLVNHMSFNTLIPTMSFTDVMYSGEHEQYENLTRFRVRWTGKQWGFWSILLGGDAHIYEPLHMTWCLLHGVSVWPQGWQDRNDASRKTANLWLTYDRFGYREAQWIPYYEAGKLVRPVGEQVKASLYLLRGKRALIVVGNLEPKVVQAQVALDLKAMGLQGRAHNALTDQPVNLEQGKLSLRLRPSTFALVWVE